MQTFRGFVLSATFEDGKPAGKFEVVKGRGDARTSPGCRIAGVSHANLRSKTSVHMIWKAPSVSFFFERLGMTMHFDRVGVGRNNA